MAANDAYADWLTARIKVLMDSCYAAAVDQGFTGGPAEYERTAADMEYVTDALYFKPTDAEWRATIGGVPGGAHVGDGTRVNNLLVTFRAQEGQHAPDRWVIVPRYNYVASDAVEPVTIAFDKHRLAAQIAKVVDGVEALRDMLGPVPVQLNARDREGFPAWWSRTTLTPADFAAVRGA